MTQLVPTRQVTRDLISHGGLLVLGAWCLAKLLQATHF